MRLRKFSERPHSYVRKGQNISLVKNKMDAHK